MVLLLTFNDVMVKEILEALLPSQLTEDELTKIINEIFVDQECYYGVEEF